MAQGTPFSFWEKKKTNQSLLDAAALFMGLGICIATGTERGRSHSHMADETILYCTFIHSAFELGQGHEAMLS